MNRQMSVIACVLVASTSVMHAAETGFSRSLRPADFSAAGLTKLSAAELARLDALVREYNSAASVATTAPSAAQSTAIAASVATAPVPNAAARDESIPAAPRRSGAPPKVVVAPGTQVEYSQIESRIAGEFSGWGPRSIFTLENGQRWQADASGTYIGDRVQNPAVKITPGLFGSYWMTVEGVKQRVKVKPVGGQ